MAVAVAVMRIPDGIKYGAVLVALIAALLTWFSLPMLMEASPKKPQPGSGQVIPFEVHNGDVHYISEALYLAFWGLAISLGATVIIAVPYGLVRKWRAANSDD